MIAVLKNIIYSKFIGNMSVSGIAKPEVAMLARCWIIIKGALRYTARPDIPF